MSTLKIRGLTMPDLDLLLAILHHLFVFALFGVLFSELVVVRRGMDAAAVVRVVTIDAWYGVLAALILIVGFSRVIFAAKGWAYYAHNGFFWAKIGTFIVIGLLSVPPTLAFLKWRRADASPKAEAVAKVRPYLWIQMALFPLLPAFAATMARGYGEF
jgi:putative membrane protein